MTPNIRANKNIVIIKVFKPHININSGVKAVINPPPKMVHTQAV